MSARKVVRNKRRRWAGRARQADALSNLKSAVVVGSVDPISLAKLVRIALESGACLDGIKSATGLHQQTQRRLLKLLLLDPRVQARIADGRTTQAVGIELASCAEQTQSRLASQIAGGRKLTRTKVREARAEDNRKLGLVPPIIWRSKEENHREAHFWSQHFMSLLEEGREPTDPELVEARSFLMSLLWQQGNPVGELGSTDAALQSVATSIIHEWEEDEDDAQN